MVSQSARCTCDTAPAFGPSAPHPRPPGWLSITKQSGKNTSPRRLTADAAENESISLFRCCAKSAALEYKQETQTTSSFQTERQTICQLRIGDGRFVIPDAPVHRSRCHHRQNPVAEARKRTKVIVVTILSLAAGLVVLKIGVSDPNSSVLILIGACLFSTGFIGLWLMVGKRWDLARKWRRRHRSSRGRRHRREESRLDNG